MISKNRDVVDATTHGKTAATAGQSLWTEDSESLPNPMQSEVARPIVGEQEETTNNGNEQNVEAEQKSENGHMGIKVDGADPGANCCGLNAPSQSHIDSLPVEYPSDALLDENTRALSKEIDELFANLENFGASEVGEETESDPFTNISNVNNLGREEEDLRSTLDQGTQIIEEHADKSTAATDTMSTTAQDITSNSDAQENSIGSSIDDTISLQPSQSMAPIVPVHRRNSSTPRRRNRPVYQMESISETGNGQTERKDESGDRTEIIEDFFERENVSEQERLVNIDLGNDSLAQQQDSHDPTNSTTSTSFSPPTPRRRVRASGESTTGSAGGNSSSTGSGRGSRGSSGARLRRNRRHIGRRNSSSAVIINDEDNTSADDTERRRRTSGSGNALVASLDAGMARLRRWVRSRRLSFGNGASTPGAGGSSGHSVSSMTTMRLGEEDIFALSHTGSDPRRVTNTAVSSVSSDPTRNIFESNDNNGFLYYRPFEVHIHDHDLDVESGIYGSDDESGARSILLHPLVPSTESGSIDESDSHRSRQRASSEPDRARVADFFSSVYGSRAIDGGGTQESIVAAGRSHLGRALRQSRSRSSTSLRPVVSTSPIIEEESFPPDQDRVGVSANGIEPTMQQLQSSHIGDEQLGVSSLEVPDATALSHSSLSETAAESLPGGEEHGITRNSSNAVNSTPDLTRQSAADPNRDARTRWIRINRRFRFIITSVAVVFSLLLFCVLIAWVLLTSTYILSHNKTCDVPLKPYFWFVTIQLILDVFRADIMKWLCRWQSDSQRRIPPRVIMYNLGYLIYAMVVLRLGVRSVFISESTCYSTAPELFYASLVFVCLSLLAWATIILGYLIPFFFVAVLLTRNGYFPNGNISSSRGVMGGRRARIGTGRINGIVGEVFPNTYSNPAPPGCVERLRVVLLHEFPDSYQKECCICMMEYKEGEVILATPCDHVFHKRCMQEWFQLSRTCPVCRTDVPEALGLDEGTGTNSSISESEVIRGQSREVHQGMNFAHIMRSERMQTDHDTSNHPEDTNVIDLNDTASRHSGRGSNQSSQPAQNQQLDA